MPDDSFELALTAMAHGGHALGRHGGRTIFVPYTLPGEIIEARITGEKGRVAFAEGLTLLEASSDRIYPRCPHFGPGRCGQCQWQHIDYPAQLLLKQDVLADQLARIGDIDGADVRPVIASPELWGYNHHMMMIAGENRVPGFASLDDERVILIEECHILHPDLIELYLSLDLQFDGLRRLRLQIGSDGHPMLILTMADDNAPELQTDIPASINMLLSDNEPVNLIGESHSRFVVRDREFRVTAGSYFRANVAQIPALVDLVLSALDGASTVLDLYGGVGTFSAFVAPQAEVITLVESYPPAVTDADINLLDFDNIDLIEGRVEDLLPELEPGYEAAILDPPGAGLSVEVIDGLAILAIPRLVYISSDPATLARDAKRLLRQGYHLGPVMPIDFAPHTYYIDSLAIFNR